MSSKLRVLALKLVLKAGVAVMRRVYKLRIEGAEYVPSEGACVIVCNKQGPIPGTWALELIQPRRKLETLGVFGVHWVFTRRSFLRPRRLPRTSRMYPENASGRLYLWGYKVPGRSGPELFRALQLLSQGTAIGMFAEGEMSWDGRLQPLQPGAAWLSLKAHVPVVPIVTVGAYDILPRWTKWPRLRGKLTIRVGPPFYVSEAPHARVTTQMVQETSQKIWGVLNALIAQGV